jgi:hypothetical protein
MIRIEIVIDQAGGKELSLEMVARHCQATRAERLFEEGLREAVPNMVTTIEELIDKKYANHKST